MGSEAKNGHVPSLVRHQQLMEQPRDPEQQELWLPLRLNHSLEFIFLVLKLTFFYL